ncbi:hypothetical protein PV325_000891 [Microctonus aethiopoides]|nr:hypothetical protein PV325_000891 [Microctonus aethiopoides]
MTENNCDDENVKVKRMRISEADHQKLSINDLPDECLLEIFSWFQPGELLQVDKVCQRWESLCEQLWKKMTKISSKYGRWTIDHIIWYEIDSKTHVNHMKKLLKRCGKYVTHFNTSNLFSKNASNITKNLLTTVPQLCKNLTKLEIGWLDEKLELDFCKILENNKNLKKLIINSKLDGQMISRLTGKFLQYLSPHVEKICLDKTYYNRDSYSFITAFRKCKCLQLFQCEGIFDYAMMQALTKNRSLIMLSLSSAEFKSPMRSINTLGNLVNLKKLSLSFVQQLEDDNLIHISNNCKQLKALNINSCYEITDTGIVSIANLSKLESLNMGNLDIVTDDSIGNLSGSLGRLWCFGCHNIKNDGVIKLIKKSSKLWYINLINTSTTEALNQIVEEVNRTRSSCDQIEILTGKTDYESYESPLGALIVYSYDEDKTIIDDTVFFNDEILINNMEFCYFYTLVDINHKHYIKIKFII